jgi:biopolymer transport protein ExbD
VHGEDTLAEIHEINVTPFIDVILVLLIIFMRRHRWRPSNSRSICQHRLPSHNRDRRSRCFSPLSPA